MIHLPVMKEYSVYKGRRKLSPRKQERLIHALYYYDDDEDDVTDEEKEMLIDESSHSEEAIVSAVRPLGAKRKHDHLSNVDEKKRGGGELYKGGMSRVGEVVIVK